MKILKRIVKGIFIGIAAIFFLIGLIPMGDGSNALSDALSFKIFSNTPSMGTDSSGDFVITALYTLLVWGTLVYVAHRFWTRNKVTQG